MRLNHAHSSLFAIDAKSDALYFDTLRSRGVWVSLSTGSGFTPAQMWLQHGKSSPSQIRYVDVNGDGKADAIYFDVLRSREVWGAYPMAAALRRLSLGRMLDRFEMPNSVVVSASATYAA
jgi:hypothetical protein